MRPQRAVHAVAGASARLSATPPPPSSRVRSGVAASERPRGRPPGRCTIAAASGGGTSVFIDAFNALPYELALLSAFAAGAAATAAVMTRESMLGLPLPPLPNAQRLAPAAAPDRIVTGSGVVVLQHLLNYFYPGAPRPRAGRAPPSARPHASSPPDPEPKSACVRQASRRCLPSSSRAASSPAWSGCRTRRCAKCALRTSLSVRAPCSLAQACSGTAVR